MTKEERNRFINEDHPFDPFKQGQIIHSVESQIQAEIAYQLTRIADSMKPQADPRAEALAEACERLLRGSGAGETILDNLRTALAAYVKYGAKA